MTKPASYNPTFRKSAYKSSFKAFLQIMDLWGIKVDNRCQLLGGVSETTYYKYKNKLPTHYSHDMLERISLIIGIYKALHILLTNKVIANEWVKSANNSVLFNGKAPLQKMTQPSMANLYEVRRYLDNARGGWN